MRMTTLNDTRPLTKGDVLCDENGGEVYIFDHFDDEGSMIVSAIETTEVVTLDPLPESLHRYEQGESVTGLKTKDAK